VSFVNRVLALCEEENHGRKITRLFLVLFILYINLFLFFPIRNYWFVTHTLQGRE